MKQEPKVHILKSISHGWSDRVNPDVVTLCGRRVKGGQGRVAAERLATCDKCKVEAITK